MSTFTLVEGCMFSGKTKFLVARYQGYVDQGIHVIIVKPSLDTRYGAINEIRSHDKGRAPALLIDRTHPREIRDLVKREGAAAVIIDEVEFLPGEATRDVVTELLRDGIDVTAAGLDTDFRRQPFGATPFLERIPGDHQHLFARCVECGGPALYTERLASAGKETVVVGGAEFYKPKCEAHHHIYA